MLPKNLFPVTNQSFIKRFVKPKKLITFLNSSQIDPNDPDLINQQIKNRSTNQYWTNGMTQNHIINGHFHISHMIEQVAKINHSLKQKCQGIIDQQLDKVLSVLLTNAITNPRTMMVHSLNTLLTNLAMMDSWLLDYFANEAKLWIGK